MDMRDVTLAVLAGGAGSRMGGPKSQLRIMGEPILRWLVAQWRWEGPTLLVTAPGREHPPGASRFEREVVDAVADQGPLRGIVTALGATSTDIAVIAACDMPRIRREHLIWIAQKLAEQPETILGVFLTKGCQKSVYLEPLPCAMRAAAFSLLESRLQREDWSLQALAQHVHLVEVPDDWPPETWQNLNRPEDLADLGISFV